MKLFDIPTQRADKAIIEFAKQADQTVVFSYELTQQYQANRLRGYFTVPKGLHALLEHTGLMVVANTDNQLSIQIDPNYRPPQADPELQPKAPTRPVEPDTIPVEKVSVVGSRVARRTLGELPVPVDIFTAEALANTGHKTVGKMLQALAPSFNFSSSSLSDGTDALKPTTLRGLGPDQTLILVNGKRRHHASLVHINNSVGRGTAGTDINAIPAAAIKRIEVLRDGAAAQYGSDAIAGVINIVLKDNNDKGAIISGSYGENKEGDGESYDISISHGFDIGDSGFLRFSINQQDSQSTNRSGVNGTCLYKGCKKLEDNVYIAMDERESKAKRDNFRIGDADANQISAVVNAGYDLGDANLYGFVTYSSRDNESAAFFRENSKDESNAHLQDNDATIIDGFLPKIKSNIDDYSFNIGIHKEIDPQSTIDISYTYGKNTIDYYTRDSINASYATYLRFGKGRDADNIRDVIPRRAYAYGLELSLATLNLDYRRDFSLFSLAIGAEYRRDEYITKSGEKYAYLDFDTVNGISLFEGQSGGIGTEDAAGGIQGFPGIAPKSTVDEFRNVHSVYTEVETDLSENVLINAAIRFDEYDGFGGLLNFKLASNWFINENLTMRGAVSTGFRAPSMQQLYFNNIGTQFIVGEDGSLVSAEVGTFRNDSRLAQTLGIPELKEEESTNWSLGSVFTLNDNVMVTVDYYFIDIEDRIVLSNRLGKGLSPILDDALQFSGAGAGQFFLNGADTETQGIDIVASWSTDVLAGQLDLTLAANFTETEVVDLYAPIGSGLEDLPTDVVFSEQDISIIEEWQPESRVTLTSLYRQEKWSINVALNRYGEYTVMDGDRQTYSSEILTDIRLAFFATKNLAFHIGANNLFDVTPDKNEIGNSRAGKILSANGDVIVDSPGIFKYSRRSAPFGFNGAFYYAGAELQF